MRAIAEGGAVILFGYIGVVLAAIALGWLPVGQLEPSELAGVCTAIFVVGAVLRLGIDAWRKFTLRARFDDARAACLSAISAFETQADDFGRRHRPPTELGVAVQVLGELVTRLSEVDPLLLWIHIQADHYTKLSQNHLEGLVAAFQRVDSSPMAFKTRIQQEREEAISADATQLVAQLGVLEEAAARFRGTRKHLAGYMLGLVVAVTSIWALSTSGLMG